MKKCSYICISSRYFWTTLYNYDNENVFDLEDKCGVWNNGIDHHIIFIFTI